jgi:hypothetical protein
MAEQLSIHYERGRVGFEDSVSKRQVEIRRVNHGVKKAEQGTRFDEVGSADGLDLSDGLHERLGRGPTEAEELFTVHAAPGRYVPERRAHGSIADRGII